MKLNMIVINLSFLQTKRKIWAFEIDISAPRIIFAENLSDINGSIILIDFGRFQLTNDCEKKELKNNQNVSNSDNGDYDSENDDEFMTPCSTPPGSKASTDDSITLCTALSEMAETSSANTLNECQLKNKFYDHFNLNLTDLQILICKAKEKWSFASAKGTSSLHILDRFNIALEVCLLSIILSIVNYIFQYNFNYILRLIVV